MISAADFCGDCGQCDNHCECSNGKRHVALVDGPAEPQFHCGKPNAENPSSRYISCELEIASTKTSADVSHVVRKWAGAIVEDGSLPDSGFEINTAPASGEFFCQQIDEICAELRDADAEVTSACGYHVHIDARDFTHADVKKLITLYAKIESALYAMVPKGRRNNEYCEPCGEKYLSAIASARGGRKAVVSAVYPAIKSLDGMELESALEERKVEKYWHGRRNALNLHSWFFRGTIECRMGAGTTNPEKVKCWAILWAAILDAAKDASEADIDNLPDGIDCLLAIAPSEPVKTFIQERTAKFA